MKIKKEKKIKIFKYIIYFFIVICLTYNGIFFLNKTITQKDYVTVFGITFFNMENDLMKDDISKNGYSENSDLFQTGDEYSPSRWYDYSYCGFTIKVNSITSANANITIEYK